MDNSTRQQVWHKGLQVFLTIVLAGAVTGYFVGMRQGMQMQLIEPAATAAPQAPKRDRSADGEAIPAAMAYTQRPRQQAGPNRDWKNSLAMLPPVEEKNGEAPDASEAQCPGRTGRPEWRAFEGAPPIIPHATPQLSAEGCMACHEHGRKIGNLFAPRMNHPFYANCMQCHSVSSPIDSANLEFPR